MVGKVVAMGFSNPPLKKPMLDGDCEQGQQGPVWFLAGVWNAGTATRSCTVPRGKYILFSIANVFWIQTPEDDKLEPVGVSTRTIFYLPQLGVSLRLLLMET
jgi:hypothetical protein